MSTPSFDAIVVGGGLAGLAAAVDLARSGARIALVERSPKLGGRCSSYIHQQTGDVVDNGQHVLAGAYHHTLAYLNVVGTRECLASRRRLELFLHHPQRGMAKFSVRALPRPFDLTAGMLSFSLLSLAERRGLLTVGFALKRWSERTEAELARLSVASWLRGLGQSENALRSLWYPIGVSVMNEEPERASALLFARSLRATLLGKKGDSAILLPTVGQTELYVTGAERLFRDAGAVVLKDAAVRTLEIHRHRAQGVRLATGDLLRAKTVISAVPYHAVAGLLPQALRGESPFADCARFRSSPIVSVHLWFDREVMDVDYVGLIDRTVQWLFDRDKLTGSRAHQVSGVISGAHGIVGRRREEISAIALREIREVFPKATAARCTASVVIKERRATFSPTNAVEPYRPGPQTPVEGFLLAGDWTNTGLPATIEGAVMSGFRASRLAQ